MIPLLDLHGGICMQKAFEVPSIHCEKSLSVLASHQKIPLPRIDNSTCTADLLHRYGIITIEHG
jgi:hypothetical protein